MIYSLRVANSFARDLRKLRQTDRDRIWKALEEIQKAPYEYKILGGQLVGTRSARVGNLRVLYLIEELGKRIVLFHAGHRERVYEG